MGSVFPLATPQLTWVIRYCEVRTVGSFKAGYLLGGFDRRSNTSDADDGAREVGASLEASREGGDGGR